MKPWEIGDFEDPSTCLGKYRHLSDWVANNVCQTFSFNSRSYKYTSSSADAMRIAGVIYPPPPNSPHGARPLFKVARGAQRGATGTTEDHHGRRRQLARAKADGKTRDYPHDLVVPASALTKITKGDAFETPGWWSPPPEWTGASRRRRPSPGCRFPGVRRRPRGPRPPPRQPAASAAAGAIPLFCPWSSTRPSRGSPN